MAASAIGVSGYGCREAEQSEQCRNKSEMFRSTDAARERGDTGTSEQHPIGVFRMFRLSARPAPTAGED